MASYNTNLKDWGSTGSEPPDGYSYAENEPPIDVFDNWFNNNVVNDIEHLTSLTNSRIESDSGATRPSSPENAHLFSDTDDGKFEWYDPTTSSWETAASKDWVQNDLLNGLNPDDFHQEGKEALNFLLNKRSSNPSSPDTGQMWYRSDLD